ncbi:MAG: TonB family protein [Paludibacteraceae bacterium]|nr:TonB family protein [Paludibacteraceae bacterium]
MAKGKSVCEYLKGIRRQIAKANGIDYSPIHCTHKGDCAGTCPACEQEREYLERQLSARQKMGAPIKIIGLSMALASGSACSSGPSSPANPSERNPNLDDTVLLDEEFRPACSDSSNTHDDSSGPEEMDWESVPPPCPVDTFRYPELDGMVARSPESPGKEDSTQSAPKVLESTQPDDDVIMGAVVMTPPPSFPGGRDSLIAFLKENLHYPQSAIDDRIEGTVRVRFVVRPDGTISNANVTQSVDPRLDEEALRIVRSMPNWKPSSKGVNTPYILPIRFSLEGNNPTTSAEEVKESE